MSATIKIKFLAPLLALLSLFRYPAVPADPPVITVLCYHTFDSPLKKNSYSVSSAQFNEEMRYLKVQKIPVISLKALEDHLSKKAFLPERSAIITIDDGYKTAKDIAWPILKRYGYPMVLFVYPHAISHLRSAMTWDDLRFLARSGADVESHSMTHPLLTHPGNAMNPKEYDAWIDQELGESKHRIEEELHHPVSSIAYPYGGYDEHIVERTHMAGYAMAFTCNDGDISGSTPPLRLNRRLIFRGTSLKAFAESFQGRPLEISDLSPKDGARIKDIPVEIQAKIMDIGAILPETLQILVDKVGRHWRPIGVDVKTGLVRFPVPPTVRRGYYFVSLRAQNKAHPTLRNEATWLFIVIQNRSKK